MDAAATAINKLLSGSGQQQPTAPATQQKEALASADVDTTTTTTGAKDTTVEQEVAPAVEHETVRHEHETREQTVVDRERHQDHYHTTIQPLQDREVEPTRHDRKTEAVEERQVNKDSEGDAVQAKVAAERNFKSTSSEAATKESKAKEATIEGETVHHHLHETIQPVIVKEKVVPEVTHVKKPVHEVVKEQSVNLGVTEAKPMSVDQFQGKLSGESKTEVVHNGGHEVSDKTAVTTKED